MTVYGKQRCRTIWVEATQKWHVVRPNLGTVKTLARFNTEAAANKRRDYENQRAK